nr:TetR/AcrR family transcriptional regulator [uncultured Anaeromusa sp.]
MARPPQDPQIRINEILDVAEPMFYANGYHETAISDIVKKMGVAQGTFYYYFKSKEDILEALINRHFSKFFSEAKVIARLPSFSPTQKIERVINEVFQMLNNNGEGLLFEYLYNDKSICFMDKLARQGKQLLQPVLLEIVESGIQCKVFHVANAVVTVRVMVAILDSLLEAFYEGTADELLQAQFVLTENLLGQVLGMHRETLALNKNFK